VDRVFLSISREPAVVQFLCNRKVNIRVLVDPGCPSVFAICNYFGELYFVQCVGTAVALSADQTTNPNTEERKMRTHGDTLRGNETIIPHVDLESVKEWAKATFTRERMPEVALCAATVSLIVVVVVSLHRAMENYIILGF
jgi:hypothetical protein